MTFGGSKPRIRCKLKGHMDWARHPSGQRYCKPCKLARSNAFYHANRKEELVRFREVYQKNKKRVAENTLRSRKKHPHKEPARNKLRAAVRSGKLKRLPCEKCGNPKSHGHHTDYSKPLDVIWLCVTHHMELHRKYKQI